MKTNLEPEKRYYRGVTTDLGGGRGRNNRKTLPTRGHNRPRGRNNGKTLPTRGHNRPFRCLDSDNDE